MNQIINYFRSVWLLSFTSWKPWWVRGVIQCYPEKLDWFFFHSFYIWFCFIVSNWSKLILRKLQITIFFVANFMIKRHSFIKSWFFGMQQFSYNPAGIFSLKGTLKIYKGIKKSAKSASPRVYHWIPSLKRNVIYSQTIYHWIPQGFRFPLILICLRVNDTLKIQRNKKNLFFE